MTVNDFEKWFFKATRRFERGLLKLGAALLLLLFISQYLLSHESLQGFLNYMVRLEGPRVEEVFAPDTGTAVEQQLELELALEGDPGERGVAVLINQEERALFTGPRVYLEVREGDMIEIDSREPVEPVTVRVVRASPLLKTPLVGQSVTTFGTSEILGWVTLD